MTRRTGISLLAGVFALAVAGCGSSGNSDSIPSTDANSLLQVLASMQAQIDQGDCTHLTGTAQEFATQVSGLPSDVPDEVRSALNKQAASLNQLAADPTQCTETGASGAVGAATTSTSTTESVPTETTTTTTDQSTTSTPPEQQAPQHDPNQTPPAGNPGGGPPGGTPPGQGGDGGSTDTGGVTPGGKGPAL